VVRRGWPAFGLFVAGIGWAPVLRAESPVSFPVLCNRLVRDAARAKRTVVEGTDGWLFLASDLNHLARPETAAEPVIPVIVDYHRQLAAAGIALWVVPVPVKPAVYPDLLDGSMKLPGNAPPSRVDAVAHALMRKLEGAGVAVIDLMPALSASRYGESGPAYCRTDTHWSGRGCVLAAEILAGRVGALPWAGSVPRVRVETEYRPAVIAGDLTRGIPGREPEKLVLGFVGRPGKEGLDPLPPDSGSPVLLMGDSFCLVFHAGGDLFATGAGLPDHLARALGFPVDLIGIRGSAATAARVTLMRRARAKPEWLRRKKLVIWCFSARELTEGDGWRKVPVPR
jgi:alginate O-acetyltransferase complex protein AlgJ